MFNTRENFSFKMRDCWSVKKYEQCRLIWKLCIVCEAVLKKAIAETLTKMVLLFMITLIWKWNYGSKSFTTRLPYLPTYLSIYLFIYLSIYQSIYLPIYDSQTVHHNPCFNLLRPYNNSLDNQGSKINKNNIILCFNIPSFTKTFFLYVFILQNKKDCITSK